MTSEGFYLDTGCEPWAVASSAIAAIEAGLRRQASDLEDVRRHALSVTLLRWESPAGHAFRSYLSERCTELSRTIDLLEAAAQDLRAYCRVVRDAELLQLESGP